MIVKPAPTLFLHVFSGTKLTIFRSVALLTGFPLFLTVIQLPERFQIVNSTSPIGAGVRLMPLLFASAFGSSFAGFCSSRKNNTFWTLLGASSLMLIGCGLMSSVSGRPSLQPSMYGYQVIFGLGIGMTFSTVIILVSLEVEFRDYGKLRSDNRISWLG